jgi:hypothetical protein
LASPGWFAFRTSLVEMWLTHRAAPQHKERS